LLKICPKYIDFTFVWYGELSDEQLEEAGLLTDLGNGNYQVTDALLLNIQQNKQFTSTEEENILLNDNLFRAFQDPIEPPRSTNRGSVPGQSGSRDGTPVTTNQQGN